MKGKLAGNGVHRSFDLVLRGPRSPKVVSQARRREAKRALFGGRDVVLCCFCQKPLTYAEATIEHVRPQSRGGTWDLANLRISCSPCNSARGDMGYQKFRGRI